MSAESKVREAYEKIGIGLMIVPPKDYPTRI